MEEHSLICDMDLSRDAQQINLLMWCNRKNKVQAREMHNALIFHPNKSSEPPQFRALLIQPACAPQQ